MILDPKDPFYRPLWRRVVIVGVIFGWALLELLFASPTWAAGLAVGGVWVAWMLFVKGPGDET